MVNTLVRSIVLASITIGLGASPALADALAPANLQGFDGILTRCVISTDREYAGRMCDRLIAAAEKEAKTNSISHQHAGTENWNSGMVSPTMPQGSQFKTTLWLTFFVRGTGGKVPGALARASFHMPFAAAVEQGDTGGTPREGQLVIWEESIIGSGPAKQLGPAVADAVAKKMAPVFTALAKANLN